MKPKLAPFLLIAPALFFLVAFFFVPSIYNLKISFTDVSLLEISKGGKFIGLGNYSRLLHDPGFWRAFRNTAVWLTAFTVILRVVIGLPIAILFDSRVLVEKRLSGLMRSLLLIPWATPPVVATAIWKWMLDQQYGIVNLVLKKIGVIDGGIAFFSEPSTVWFAVAAIVVWNQLPFVVVSLLAALQGIPESLLEAAKVDGAKPFQAFFYVTLPQLFPTIAIVLMLTSIWTFNNFVYVWLSTRGGPGDITNVLATKVYLEAFSNYRLGYSSAIGIVMTVVLVVAIGFYLPWMLKRSEIA